PSVATLFTGLHPRSHGVVGPSADGAPAASDPGFLADTLPTLAERAEAAGVTTVGVSGSPLVSRATNLARGFETFVEFGWDRARNDWPPAAAVNARFLAWLERNRGLRFLAYLHYMDPHDPYTPPAALRPPAPPGVRPAVAAGQAEGLARRVNAPGGSALAAVELEHLRRLYDAEIRAWDAELGTLLDALAARGLADSTIVVLTADHGEEFQEHGRLKHRIHLYDELLHVPLVIAGPGVRPGRVAEQAQGIDLFPTLAALLGTAPPRSARSCARSGTWTDGAGSRARPRAGARARARRDARGGRRGRAPHGGRAGLDRRRLLPPGGAHGVGPVRCLAAARGGGRAGRGRARAARPMVAQAAGADGAPRRARAPRRPRGAARRGG